MAEENCFSCMPAKMMMAVLKRSQNLEVPLPQLAPKQKPFVKPLDLVTTDHMQAEGDDISEMSTHTVSETGAFELSDAEESDVQSNSSASLACDESNAKDEESVPDDASWSSRIPFDPSIDEESVPDDPDPVLVQDSTYNPDQGLFQYNTYSPDQGFLQYNSRNFNEGLFRYNSYNPDEGPFGTHHPDEGLFRYNMYNTSNHRSFYDTPEKATKTPQRLESLDKKLLEQLHVSRVESTATLPGDFVFGQLQDVPCAISVEDELTGAEKELEHAKRALEENLLPEQMMGA